MTFEPKSFNEIFADMRRRTGSAVTDFEVGSVARTLYESFAYEIALLYEKLGQVYLSAYIDTARGQQLDLVVSILNIKRNQPDFAIGMVTFERDVGNEDIEIPLNTLVATEDSEASPKKSYVTIEAATLLKDQDRVEVKIRAVERSELQQTEAETVVVMPQPVPAIKAVTNREPIRFRGRRRETDEQLRERAKNALIASGKATIFSLENALLSLPGVTDIKVQEEFHAARGQVYLDTGTTKASPTIPKGTRLVATVNNVNKPFETVETEVLEKGAGPVTVRALQEGQAGQLFQTQDEVVWTSEDDTLTGITAINLEPIQLTQFGIVEVFVDSAGFDTADKETQARERERLQTAVDQVRAAGVMVRIEPAALIDVDAIFRIELNPALTLNSSERAELESQVGQGIHDFILERKMGQPLLFSQIIKQTLLLDDLDNMEDFVITATARYEERQNIFEPEQKRIEIESFEKFKPRYICVASETKLLPINVQFKASNLDEASLERITASLENHLATVGEGMIKRRDIREAIEQALKQERDGGELRSIEAGTLTLRPDPWCPRPLLQEADGDAVIEVSFVEQPTLGDVFAYNKYLGISGALRLILPSTSTDVDKRTVEEKIEAEIRAYFETLSSDADVVFEELITLAAAVEPVLNVNLVPEDFWIILDDGQRRSLDNDRIGPDRIDVRSFEKTMLTHMCITSEVERVRVDLTHMEIAATVPVAVIDPFAEDLNRIERETDQAVRQAVREAANNALNDAAPGDNVVYADLVNALSSTVPNVSYTVSNLSLRATALCDGRTQQAPPDVENQLLSDIHIRSVEKAFIQPVPVEAALIYDHDLTGDLLLQQVGEQTASPADFREALQALFDEYGLPLSSGFVIEAPPPTWLISHRDPQRSFVRTYVVRQESVEPGTGGEAVQNVYFPSNNLRFSLDRGLITPETTTVSAKLRTALEGGFQIAFNNPNLSLIGELELVQPNQSWLIRNPDSERTYLIVNEEKRRLNVYDHQTIQVSVTIA